MQYIQEKGMSAMKQKNTMKWIWQIARGELGGIILHTLVGAAISLSYVVFALVSQRVVDMATGQMHGDMWMQSGILIGILLLQALLGICNQLLQTHTTTKIEMRMKERVFTALYRKKWQRLSAYSSGDILHRLTGDAGVTATAVATLIPRVVSLFTRLIAALVVLIMMDKLFTGILLLAGGALLLFSRLYGGKIKKLHALCQQTEGDTRFFMQESIEDWTVVQAFRVVPWMQRRLKELQTANYKHKIRRSRISSIANMALYLLFTGCYYIALAWGAWRLASGAITFGTLTAFLQIVQQVQTPFRNMSGIMPQYYNMLSSAERLIELEMLPDEPLTVCENMPPLRAITVSDITFSYDRDLVFRGASLTVKKGEFVALVGHSGIGKSTLFKLLLGFLEPESGRIVCETETGEISVGAGTRPYFSYVPQGNLLLSGTIRQNLVFCCENATDEEIWAAAEVAAIADFIRELPAGLDTPLGEKGLGLSDGQLQRLSIARGVLYDAPVLLLDEATSALDEETEKQVLRNLHALPDKTCICISHRPAAMAVCDRVLHVRDGRFEEETVEKE